MVCGTDSDDSLSRAGSAAADSFTNGPTRSTPKVTQSNRTTRTTTEITAATTAAAKKQLQKRASSKQIKKAADGTQQQQEGQADNGLIKASYPATPEGAAAAPAAAPAAAAKGGLAAAAILKGGTSRRALPIALRYQGAILSDSDSDDEGLPAAQADNLGLLAPGHVDSAAPAAAAAVAPAPAAPVVLPAPAVLKPVVLVAPPSRGKAAAVRQAVAGAAQAAGRAIAAAQAGASAGSGSAMGPRQAEVQVVVPADTAGRSSSPIVLTPPKRSAFAAAVGADADKGVGTGSPRSAAAVQQPQQGPAGAGGARGIPPKAAAAQWEPAFPQAGTEAQEQEQQAGSWAEGGWSNVAL